MGKMQKKEPQATREEYNRRVVRYRDAPVIELVRGSKSHVVSVERMTVSFVVSEPDVYVPPHRHESEQIVIVNDGACDFMVGGKLYHLEKEDILIIPPNIEHGNYVSSKGLRMMEVFSPPRYDIVEKLRAAGNDLKT